MRPSLSQSPGNRAFEVFKSLFEDELDLGAWLWKHKHKIVPDCIYEDGEDGTAHQFIESIETVDLENGLITVLDGMPSIVTVYGIGTNCERAEIEWINYEASDPTVYTELRPAEERTYERTLADYEQWAKANDIAVQVPIMTA